MGMWSWRRTHGNSTVCTWLHYLEVQDTTDITRESKVSREQAEPLPLDDVGTWILKTEKRATKAKKEHEKKICSVSDAVKCLPYYAR